MGKGSNFKSHKNNLNFGQIIGVQVVICLKLYTTFINTKLVNEIFINSRKKFQSKLFKQYSFDYNLVINYYYKICEDKDKIFSCNV